LPTFYIYSCYFVLFGAIILASIEWAGGIKMTDKAYYLTLTGIAVFLTPAIWFIMLTIVNKADDSVKEFSDMGGLSKVLFFIAVLMGMFLVIAPKGNIFWFLIIAMFLFYATWDNKTSTETQ